MNFHREDFFLIVLPHHTHRTVHKYALLIRSANRNLPYCSSLAERYLFRFTANDMFDARPRQWYGSSKSQRKLQTKSALISAAASYTHSFVKSELGQEPFRLFPAAFIKNLMFDIGHHRIVSPTMSQNKKYHRARYE